eukprot:Protomagalhaensia_wolfi_Nauph_80__2157@NODE_238_length_3074_cov_12_148929_g178_i0_p3_GENE_NODE_238_length_3074_cov_12_148929_g178_i0NODE_238_length_3074_cov_12_148929_g178_i0_p3_ORF_typecomplete_len307_score28_62_NODE_238_length_3074_cov_12_148929_g178_i09421862
MRRCGYCLTYGSIMHPMLNFFVTFMGYKWRALGSELQSGQQTDFVFFRHSLTALLSASLQHNASESTTFQLVFPDGSVGLATTVDPQVVSSDTPVDSSNDQTSIPILHLQADDLSTRLRAAENEWIPLYVTKTTNWKYVGPWAATYSAAFLLIWVAQLLYFKYAVAGDALFSGNQSTEYLDRPSFFFGFVRIPTGAFFNKSRLSFLTLSLQFLFLFNFLLVPFPWIKRRPLVEIATTFGTYLYNSVVPVLIIHYVISCINRNADMLQLLSLVGSLVLMRVLEYHLVGGSDGPQTENCVVRRLRLFY